VLFDPRGYHHFEHGRDAREKGGLVLLDHPSHILGIKARDEYHGNGHGHQDKHVLMTRGMRHRHDQQGQLLAVSRNQRQQTGVVPDGEKHALMGEHGPPRLAGGTGGVEDNGRVLGISDFEGNKILGSRVGQVLQSQRPLKRRAFTNYDPMFDARNIRLILDVVLIYVAVGDQHPCA